MWSSSGFSSWSLVVSIVCLMILVNALKFCYIHLFADDSNLFYASKSLLELESLINAELKLVDSWLCSNKRSLNISKSSFVIFHPSQKKPPFSVRLTICDQSIKEMKSIQYLGVIIDSNFKWKEHVNYLTIKIKTNVGLLSKIRYFVDQATLVSLYYALVYPYFTYSLIAWGHTYKTIINPLIVLCNCMVNRHKKEVKCRRQERVVKLKHKNSSANID